MDDQHEPEIRAKRKRPPANMAQRLLTLSLQTCSSWYRSRMACIMPARFAIAQPNDLTCRTVLTEPRDTPEKPFSTSASAASIASLASFSARSFSCSV